MTIIITSTGPEAVVVVLMMVQLVLEMVVLEAEEVHPNTLMGMPARVMIMV